MSLTNQGNQENQEKQEKLENQSELRAQLKHYRLSEEEYERMVQVLGREPQGVEWALFSALWSEHCSYKSSKIHLRKLFNQSPRVLESFGENAGVIDLGEGERVAFKMESHNHPSYIEPYQGAATGVGGIIRDIFTMNARPIALGNYLCFGTQEAPRMPALIDGVVRGIAGYGNCVGVPTITGQTEFHPSYNGNILVNAFALGLFRPGMKVVNSKARGVGNWVVYVGAKTGRDGIHGASMASESFAENSEAKKPTVQIGDPFYEKLLIESCLEVMAEDLVVAIQDMGAAGLTSSSFEMASKGRVGLTLHLDRVPLRDSTMTPEEILLSESQERMLLVCEPQKFPRLKEIFDHWNLDAAVVGELTNSQQVQLFWHGENISTIDPDVLVENAPVYQRPYHPWKPQRRITKEITNTQYESVDVDVSDPKKVLLEIMSSLPATSRQWIFQQYDQRVGGATVRDCKDSVAVVRLPDSGRAMGLVLGCRPALMRWDADQGGKDSVAYPALELACKGFEPLAVTDCLNFGNPEKVELMSEFVASVEGMSACCEELQIPIISGNVSFYNETQQKNVTSTPATGLVGLRKNVKGIPTSYFTETDQEIYLLTLPVESRVELSGHYQEMKTGTPMWGRGDINLKAVKKMVKLLETLTQGEQVLASRVVGKFGLAYALARMTLTQGVGAQIVTASTVSTTSIVSTLPVDSLFSEYLYQVILTVNKIDSHWLKQSVSTEPHVQLYLLGVTGGDDLQWGDKLKVAVKELTRSYQCGWEEQLEILA